MPITPITDQRQLVEFFADAAKPRAEWRIASAHEKFAYRLSTLRPVGYDEPNGLRDWLTGMEGFGWVPIREKEGGNIISLVRGQEMIELETGGQVGFYGARLQTLHEVSAEIDQHLMEACQIGEGFGIGFLGMGFHPAARREDIGIVPKARARILRDFAAKRGASGLDAVLRSAGAFVGLHYESEADMARKFRLALALQPIVVAMFASSPFVEDKPNSYCSNRMRALAETSGNIWDFAFEDGFGYERYAEAALDAPMIFVERDGRVIDCAGQSFRDFLDRKLPALPNAVPTLKDWADHLAGIFSIVRLGKTIEMRGADAGSPEMILALPSFWTGILYDSTACDDAWQLVKGWTVEDRHKLYADTPRLGFAAEIGGRKVLDIARDAVTIAIQGLRRRVYRLYGGADETRALAALVENVESGQSRADYLLMQQEHFADFTVASIFDTGRLRPPPEREEEIL